MKIKAKFQVVAVLPLLVFFMAAAIAIWVQSTNERLYARGSLVVEVLRTTQILVNLTYEYGITRGERAKTQWNNQYAEAGRLLREMPILFDRPADDPEFEELRRCFQQSGRLFSALLDYDRWEPPPNGDGQALLVRNNLVNRVILDLQNVLPLTDKLHSGVVQATKRSRQQGALLTVGLVFLLALAFLSLAFLVTSGINRSLGRLQDGIRRVADGDLQYRVNLEERDEIGDLARGFDEMTARLGAVTVSRDALEKEIAGHRLAEEALVAREAQLAEAQRIAQLGSWELELTSNTLRWSEEIFRIFEIDPQAFGATYEAFLDAIHPEDRDMVNQAYGNSLAMQTPYEIEHRLLMPDGRVKYVHERCETRFDPSGKALRSLGTVQDVSARRQAEEVIRHLNEELEGRVASRTADLQRKSQEVEDVQRALMNIVEDLSLKTAELGEANRRLQDVDRLKSMFIASMSHELRTPLNSIIGFSSIVHAEWLGPLNDEQKAKLAIVLRTGKHLLTLINDVIDISKIEAGKLESVTEDFDLHDLITEAAGIIGADSAAKGIALRVEAIHLPMRTDRRRLYQCVVNLLGNAVKFTRQGTITVKAAPVDGQDRPMDGLGLVAISVTDTGIGIKEEDLPRLYTSFVRLPLPEDMQAKGTGLGLYLVKKIVTEILGGTVDTMSVHGQGSTFTLTVPVQKQKD